MVLLNRFTYGLGSSMVKEVLRHCHVHVQGIGIGNWARIKSIHFLQYWSVVRPTLITDCKVLIRN